MKRVISTLIVSIVALLPSAALADAGDKLMIFSDNARFLGDVVPGQSNFESICHPFGLYGSENGLGIYNPYSIYGDANMPNSAYNPTARKFPVLMNGNGQIVGFITKNPTIPYRIDPDVLRSQVCGG